MRKRKHKHFRKFNSFITTFRDRYVEDYDSWTLRQDVFHFMTLTFKGNYEGHEWLMSKHF